MANVCSLHVGLSSWLFTLVLKNFVYTLDKVCRFANSRSTISYPLWFLYLPLIGMTIRPLRRRMLLWNDLLTFDLPGISTQQGHTPRIWLLNLVGIRLVIIIQNVFLSWLGLTVNVIVDWVLDATEGESSIENGSAVFFVALSEAWVLVKLSQDFIERRHRQVMWQVLQFVLDLLAGKLLLFFLLLKLELSLLLELALVLGL